MVTRRKFIGAVTATVVSAGFSFSKETPEIIFVDSAAKEKNTGLSWEDAFADLDEAVKTYGEMLANGVIDLTFAPKFYLRGDVSLRHSVYYGYFNFVGDGANIWLG